MQFSNNVSLIQFLSFSLPFSSSFVSTTYTREVFFLVEQNHGGLHNVIWTWLTGLVLTSYWNMVDLHFGLLHLILWVICCFKIDIFKCSGNCWFLIFNRFDTSFNPRDLPISFLLNSNKYICKLLNNYEFLCFLHINI